VPCGQAVAHVRSRMVRMGAWAGEGVPGAGDHCPATRISTTLPKGQKHGHARHFTKLGTRYLPGGPEPPTRLPFPGMFLASSRLCCSHPAPNTRTARPSGLQSHGIILCRPIT